MAGDGDGFLSRWSRLKRTGTAERTEGQGAALPQPQPQPAPAPAAPETPPDTPETPELPDIASLTKESDFTAFLRAGVPEHLHREALRALWKSDPIFSHHDGLTDYAEDFANPEVVGDAVKTAWKIGRGFLEDEPPPPAAAPPADDSPEQDGNA